MFPACAGMNRALSQPVISSLNVPRVCGDEPLEGLPVGMR